MKHYLKVIVLAIALIAGYTTVSLAGGQELAYFKLQSLDTLSSGSIGSGDYIAVYDASAGKVKKVDATAYPSEGGAFNGTVGATTPSTGEFTTVETDSLTVGGGTELTSVLVATDAVASGQTSKTVTVTGATASSKCVATANEVATNAVYIRSAAPGTNQVVVTVSGDPGASNLDLTVICVN